MKERQISEILNWHQSGTLKTDEAVDRIMLLFGIVKSFCCCDKPVKYIDYSLDKCMCKKCGRVVKQKITNMKKVDTDRGYITKPKEEDGYKIESYYCECGCKKSYYRYVKYDDKITNSNDV